MKKSYIEPNLEVIEMEVKEILMGSIELNDTGGTVQEQGELDLNDEFVVY